jgi:hypothetical protein
MMKVGGVPTEEAYGNYLGQDGYCHVNNVTLVAPITGFVNVTSNNEAAFKLALFKNGPLSVAVSFEGDIERGNSSFGNRWDDFRRL